MDSVFESQKVNRYAINNYLHLHQAMKSAFNRRNMLMIPTLNSD